MSLYGAHDKSDPERCNHKMHQRLRLAQKASESAPGCWSNYAGLIGISNSGKFSITIQYDEENILKLECDQDRIKFTCNEEKTKLIVGRFIYIGADAEETLFYLPALNPWKLDDRFIFDLHGVSFLIYNHLKTT